MTRSGSTPLTRILLDRSERVSLNRIARLTPRRATSLRPGQLKQLIRVASVTGCLPDREVMLLWLTHTTGIRLTELAMLVVADVLYPNRTIKPEVCLRADIAKGYRPRNVRLTHAQCMVSGWFPSSLGAL